MSMFELVCGVAVCVCACYMVAQTYHILCVHHTYQHLLANNRTVVQVKGYHRLPKTNETAMEIAIGKGVCWRRGYSWCTV